MATEEAQGPTLTNVTHAGRLIVKYGAIGLVVLMVGRVTFNTALAFWKALNPEPPPPPTVGFGILPSLEFPVQLSTDTPVSYSLETATGTLPDFGDRAKVFFMPKSAASLLADQATKNLVSKFGFTTEPEMLSDELYRFSKTAGLISTLDINIRTQNLELSTNYLSLPELVINPETPSPFDAVSDVKAFLKSADLLPQDIATASGEVVFLKSLGGELQPAVSQSDADFIQVDINRIPIDDTYRFYTPSGYEGIAQAVISGKIKQDSGIVALSIKHNPVDYDQMETYPLRSAQSAWQLLQAGEGYIAQAGTAPQAVVRSVSLGYYDSFEEQNYLQPIYVFENLETGFLGYISAVDPSYIQK